MRRTQREPTENKLLHFLAEFISVVCHPVFFPLVMAIIIYWLAPGMFSGITHKQLGLWWINIGFTAVFFPLFTIGLLKPLGFISSFRMPTTKDRIIPLMAAMTFYFWVSHVFNSMGIATKLNPNPGPVPPLIYKVFLLGNLWGIILVFMANIFVKISMHTSIAGALVGILIVLAIMSPANMALPIIIGTAVAIMIGIARWVLGAHQKGDIVLGYIIGVLVQLGAYLFMK